ncbi:hypothetical protein VaNZ11_003411 [Volvox africanus]|uniref:SAC3/GANP/THP3 conserved domain-containing protein n=1 Tax=Volvox africanus TaxID=51714 RepID=A0ABQ5RUM4_9CHLO|nr:hypothetical protein VaNZ11_003411 [Volvox africanus]
MFGGGAGAGNFGASTQQGQAPSGGFGGRGGGFGGATGRGFGGGNAGGAFTGRMLFGAPLPSAGQVSAPAPEAGSGNVGAPREPSGGAAGGTAAPANGGQQQQQRGNAVMPGRGVFARFGIAPLREGENSDRGGGVGRGVTGHAASGHAAGGGGGGRGRGGGPYGVAPGGRQGFGGSGSGWGGRGTGRGGSRTRQQQQQHGGRKMVWVAGTQTSAGGGGDMGVEEEYDGDGDGAADDGGTTEFDGNVGADLYNEGPEDAGGGGGDGEPAATAGQPGDWRSGRAVAAAIGQSQPGAAGRAVRVPVPLFNDKRVAGGDGTGDAAKLKQRQRRFGQTSEVAGAPAAGGIKPGTGFGAGALVLSGVAGGDATPPRVASRSPARVQADTEDIIGHSPSPSPPPSPLLAYLSGGGDGMGDDDDGVAGGGAALVGTCEVMCPVAERKRREAAGELNIFERLDPHNSKLTNENLIIKKARKNYSEEDRRPENLRTFRALGLTMARLRSLIAAPDETALAATIQCSPEQTLLNVQAFLWDRYREVRKEIIAQHFHTRAEMLPQILAWNEEIARFLIISSHELWGNRDFAAQLNQEQLKKVLTDLVTRFYTSAARLGVPTPNSAEIKCYLLILMMGGTIEKNGRRFRQPAEAQMYLRQYTQKELESPWTDVLFAVMATLQSGNAVAFFDLMSRAPYTLACICASHVMPMRSLAMHMMAAAMGGPHSDQPGGRRNPDAAIPLPDLARMLKLSEANTSTYAETRQALVQPGGATGQRDVSFLSSHVTSREPRAKPQHWISSKRARSGRSQDTVNAAELSPELLSFCRLVLAGSSPSPVSHHLPIGQLGAVAGGLRSPVQGAATAAMPLQQTPLTVATGGARPPLPAAALPSPSPWEYSPEAQGSGGSKAAAAAAAATTGGKGPYGSTSGPAREARGSGFSPAKAANFVFGSPTFSAGAPATTGAAAAAVTSPSFHGFGTASTASATPAAVAAPRGVTRGFGLDNATDAPQPFSQQPMQQRQQQQQQLLPLQQQQQQQQHAQSGFAQTIQPRPNMVDAGLLAQAQRAAEVERQARENLRHQADQAIRQEHERNRALMVQFEQVAASASASQAALLEAQQRAASYAREVQSLRLEKQKEEIEKQWRGITVRRCVGKWREAAQQCKRRQEVLRQQLARVSVTFNGAWARSPLNMLRRDCNGTSGREELEAKVAAEQSPTGRKRRYDLLALNGGALTSAQAAAPTDATVFRARNGTLTPHLNLGDDILPGLCRAIANSQGTGAAASGSGRPTLGSRTVRYCSFRGAAGAAKHGFRRVEEWELGNRKWLDPALQRHVFWKMLLVSGAQEMDAHCVSGFQLEAAAWIRARLSCGRTAGPRPNRRPEVGEQLTIEAARVVVSDQACNLTMCVQDIRAKSLPSGGPSASVGSVLGFNSRAASVASDASAVATAMAATSGVMMLVDGRMLETALADGSSPQRAAVKAAQDLNESWERLRKVLSNLPSTRSTKQSQFLPQGPAQLPVVILTLGSSASTAAVGNHLAAAAATAWPPAVASRLLASPPVTGSTAALGGHVKVLSLADAPDEALRLSLSHLTISAPLYDHVVTLDLEEMARGAVAEVVSELDERGTAAATATVAATIAAYNHLLTVYEAAVMETAASPSARWGLPAPEVSVSDFDAAPACWAPERISAVVLELRRLQLPPPSPEQSKLPGGSAVLPQLLGRVATWSVTTAGPRKVMMLAALAPSLRRQLRLRVSVPPLPLPLLLPAPAGTAAHETPAWRPGEAAVAPHGAGHGLAPEPPAAGAFLSSAPVGVTAADNGAGASIKGALITPGGPAPSVTPLGYVALMADVMATPTGAPFADGPAGAGWESSNPTISAVRSPPYGFGIERSVGRGNEDAVAEVPVSETKRMATEALKALLAALGS